MGFIIRVILLLTFFVVIASGGSMVYRFILLSQGKLTGEQVFGKEEWKKMTRK